MPNNKKNKTPEEIIQKVVSQSLDASLQNPEINNIKDVIAMYSDMRKINNDIQLNNIIIKAWQLEKQQERNQKRIYIKILATVFILTIIGFFGIFVAIGLGILKYEYKVLELFCSVLGLEIIAAFVYILKELFKNSSKELLTFINSFNKK